MAAFPSPSSSADRDASSLSNPNVATFAHLSWTADVNFETHIITATATYDVKISASGNDAAAGTELWLDTRGLSIDTVEIDGTEISHWTLEDDVEVSFHFLDRYAFQHVLMPQVYSSLDLYPTCSGVLLSNRYLPTYISSYSHLLRPYHTEQGPSRPSSRRASWPRG